MIVRIRIRTGARRLARARFRWPVEPAPRTAILLPGFRQNSSVRVFAEGCYDELAAFGPEVLAARTAELRRIGRLLCGGSLRLPTLEVGLVAFTCAGTPPVDGSDRDALWSAFGLPLYEQLLGPNNETLAAECGAHDGMHILEQTTGLELKVQHGTVRVRTRDGAVLDYGLHARLATERCPCGATAPRLADLCTSLPALRRARTAAAVAH